MLLAIDTATQTTGVCLEDGDEIVAEHVWQSERYHTVELAPEVALILQRNQVSVEDLKAVAVASGPGSYTGLRIGMALAKGIALARHIPLVGVPTLDILARAQPPREEPMLALIQAGRGRYAGVWYKWGASAWKAEGNPVGLSWDELVAALESPAFVSGELGEKERQQLGKISGVTLASPALSLRRPSFLAEIARAKMRSKKKETDPASLVPTYLGDLTAAS